MIKLDSLDRIVETVGCWMLLDAVGTYAVDYKYRDVPIDQGIRPG